MAITVVPVCPSHMWSHYIHHGFLGMLNMNRGWDYDEITSEFPREIPLKFPVKSH